MKTELSKAKSRTDPEIFIANVLRYGVLVSSILIAIGVLLSCLRVGIGSGSPWSLEDVCKMNFGRPVASMGTLFASLTSLNSLSIIEVGALALIAIPFFRVFAGTLMYASRRNWIYVVISAVVMAVLIFSTLVVAPLEAGL